MKKENSFFTFVLLKNGKFIFHDINQINVIFDSIVTSIVPTNFLQSPIAQCLCMIQFPMFHFLKFPIFCTRGFAIPIFFLVVILVVSMKDNIDF